MVTNVSKPQCRQKERIALIRKIERELAGNGTEDSEEWIKNLKETHTFSEPKNIF